MMAILRISIFLVNCLCEKFRVSGTTKQPQDPESCRGLWPRNDIKYQKNGQRGQSKIDTTKLYSKNSLIRQQINSLTHGAPKNPKDFGERKGMTNKAAAS